MPVVQDSLRHYSTATFRALSRSASSRHHYEVQRHFAITHFESFLVFDIITITCQTTKAQYIAMTGRPRRHEK